MDMYMDEAGLDSVMPEEMTGVELAELAQERMADDFTARMISALILAQDAMDHDWGQVFTIVDFVMKEALERNMKKEAIDITMNYIALLRIQINS